MGFIHRDSATGSVKRNTTTGGLYNSALGKFCCCGTGSCYCSTDKSATLHDTLSVTVSGVTPVLTCINGGVFSDGYEGFSYPQYNLSSCKYETVTGINGTFCLTRLPGTNSCTYSVTIPNQRFSVYVAPYNPLNFNGSFCDGCGVDYSGGCTHNVYTNVVITVTMGWVSGIGAVVLSAGMGFDTIVGYIIGLQAVGSLFASDAGPTELGGVQYVLPCNGSVTLSNIYALYDGTFISSGYAAWAPPGTWLGEAGLKTYPYSVISLPGIVSGYFAFLTPLPAPHQFGGTLVIHDSSC